MDLKNSLVQTRIPESGIGDKIRGSITCWVDPFTCRAAPVCRSLPLLFDSTSVRDEGGDAEHRLSSYQRRLPNDPYSLSRRVPTKPLVVQTLNISLLKACPNAISTIGHSLDRPRSTGPPPKLSCKQIPAVGPKTSTFIKSNTDVACTLAIYNT